MREYIFKKKLGDRVELIAKPIAKALKMKCLDKDGNLKPESGCAKRRDKLNMYYDKLTKAIKL